LHSPFVFRWNRHRYSLGFEFAPPFHLSLPFFLSLAFHLAPPFGLARGFYSQSLSLALSLRYAFSLCIMQPCRNLRLLFLLRLRLAGPFALE
jgi:hypothetical protein